MLCTGWDDFIKGTSIEYTWEFVDKPGELMETMDKCTVHSSQTLGQ